MSFESSIEWTESTWNPVTGCTKVSPGCAHCYAERLASRLQAMGNPRYLHGFAVTLHEDLVTLPLRWSRPRTIFVNSMSDLFHESVPDSFIERVFDTMAAADWHTFQVLTKRADRLATLGASLPWPSNVWAGVSVENQAMTWRVDRLRGVPAAVRFLSCEPLLGPLQLNLSGIQWVIAGGESGPRAREMDLSWARGLRDQCHIAGVPFFLKQLGGAVDKRGHDRALLDGRRWEDRPSAGTSSAEPLFAPA
jgi:protein gp37